MRERKKDDDVVRETERSVQGVEKPRKNVKEAQGGGSVKKQLSMSQRSQRR